MSQGNEIIVSADPKGYFDECIISGTPKPGTIMYPTNTAPVNGRFTYEPAGTTGGLGMGADGDQIPIAVLLPDHLQGKTADDAYVSGTVGFLYFPIAGEKLNILFGNASGTADDVTIGMKMMVNDGDGKVIPTTGSPESEPFVALEAYTDPAADKLLLMQYTGH